MTHLIRGQLLDGRDLPSIEDDAKVVVGVDEQLRSEGCDDELRILRQLGDHGYASESDWQFGREKETAERTGNGRPAISVQVRIDLVEEIEWCWIALLDGKDCAAVNHSCTRKKKGGAPMANATTDF